MNLKARSSIEVRQQYLAQLGIVAHVYNQSSKQCHTSCEASPTVLQRLHEERPFPVDWWRQIFSRSSNVVEDKESHERRYDDEKKVSFKEMVEVRFVPIYSDYSQRVRESYWNNSQEIWDAAARNTFEFEAEGYDWRQAFEEEDFMQWQGQLIHPAHTQSSLDYMY